MGTLHWFARVIVVYMIVSAPLACVRFCELRAEVERAHAQAGTLAAKHAAIGHGQHFVRHAHADPGGNTGGRAPLNELRSMIAGVTEFLMAPLFLLAIAVVALATGLRNPRLRLAALDVPTPPPRHTIASA